MKWIANSVWLLLIFCGLCRCESKTGYFWHVTDMHWDPTYNETNAALSCNPGTPAHGRFGHYGDFNCDPPWVLLESAFDFMAHHAIKVDFVMWTGDDTPHIWDDKILDLEWVHEIIAAQTLAIQETFPNVSVFSALGNHDWSPKNELPPQTDPFYDAIFDLWEDWIPADGEATFRHGAYYSAPINADLEMVVLNTNLYYDSNPLTKDMFDPANQLQWFDDVMTDIAKEDRKAMVIGHVPPGMFEKHANKSWFYPEYNEDFLRVVKKHAGAIGSMHMAHHHTDSFRLLYNDNDRPLLPIFLAPALSPWETTLPGVMGGKGNNPSLRLVQYDRETGSILDINQYWLNLTQANLANSATWALEYQATKYYGIDILDASSLHDLAENMKTDHELFRKYYAANGVFYDVHEEWNSHTLNVHLCCIQKLHYVDYAQCMLETNGADRGASSILIFIVCVLGMQMFL